MPTERKRYFGGMRSWGFGMDWPLAEFLIDDVGVTVQSRGMIRWILPWLFRVGPAAWADVVVVERVTIRGAIPGRGIRMRVRTSRGTRRVVFSCRQETQDRIAGEFLARGFGVLDAGPVWGFG